MTEHDKSASLLEITERLDRLEALLTRLMSAVESSGVTALKPQGSDGHRAAAQERPAPKAPASPAPAAPAPAAAQQVSKASDKPAPSPPTASPSGTAESADSPPSVLTEAQREALKLNELDLTPWLPGATASIEEFLTALFRFSFEDREWGDDLMLALVHDEIVRAPRTAGSLRQFNFPKMRRLRDRYLEGGDPSSFQIHRIDEYQADQDIRVFIHSSFPGTMPGPVRIKRDEKADGAWRLVQLSL